MHAEGTAGRDDGEAAVAAIDRAQRVVVPDAAGQDAAAGVFGGDRDGGAARGVEQRGDPRPFAERDPDFAPARDDRQVPPERGAQRIVGQHAGQGAAERGEQLQVARALLRGVRFRGSRAGPALQLLAPREQMHDEQRDEDHERRQQTDVVRGFHLRGELERATDCRVEYRQQGQREAGQQEPVVTQRNPQPHISVRGDARLLRAGPAPRLPGASPPVAACGCTQPRAATRERRSRVSLSGRARKSNRLGRERSSQPRRDGATFL